MIAIRTGMTIGGTSQEPISPTLLMPRESHDSGHRWITCCAPLSTRPSSGAVPRSDPLMWIKGPGLTQMGVLRDAEPAFIRIAELRVIELGEHTVYLSQVFEFPGRFPQAHD
jgi:hypothetical protein